MVDPGYANHFFTVKQCLKPVCINCEMVVLHVVKVTDGCYEMVWLQMKENF